MRSRALRICLVVDLVLLLLWAGSYQVLEFYERKEGFYWEPGLLFSFLFLTNLSAWITTLLVWWLWPLDPGPPGTGLSPDKQQSRSKPG